MQFLTYFFWAGVLASLLAALWDSARWPRQTDAAWRRFRPVAAAVTALALGFFLVNLMRFGRAESSGLLSQSLRLLSVGLGASIFFCGGWPWVTRAGHAGLIERIQRRATGLSAPSARRAIVETCAVAAAIVGVSWLLFTLVKTEPSAAFRELIKSPERLETRSGYVFLYIVLAPIWEETIFRWYLLNRIEEALAPGRWARPMAILATAAFWACGHAAVTVPFWVKLVQIFVVGCLLAWRFPVIGLSGCILAHLAMNLAAISLP